MNGSERLPVGWRRVRLGDVLTLRKDVVHPADQPSGTSTFVGLEHVESQTGRRLGGVDVDLSRLTGRKPRFFKGDIVYGYLRPYLNKVWLAEFDGLCSVDQYVFSVNERLADATFVAWFLRSPEYLTRAPISRTPGQLPRIRVEEVLTVELALPNLSEQERFVAHLNEQMEQVERARTAAEEQFRASQKMPASILRSVSESTDARTWPVQRLGALLSRPLNTGISKPASPSGGKKCLTLSAVRDGRLDLSASKPTDVSDTEAVGNYIKPNAFYVVRGNGNRSLVGRGGLAPLDMAEPLLYPDLLIEVSVRPDQVLPDYLRLVWDSASVREQIESRARTSAGIYKINQANLADIRFAVPPLETQQALIERLDAQLLQARIIHSTVESSLRDINRLPSELLRRVFSGELSRIPTVVSYPMRPTPKDAFTVQGLVSCYAVARLHSHQTFGDVQHAKVGYLVEAHLGIDLGGKYERQQAGPFDQRIYMLTGYARKNGWYEAHRRASGRGRYYTVGPNIQAQVDAAAEFLGHRRGALDELLDAFATNDTENIEILATLYAAWNDFLLDGKNPSDSDVIREVRENWHESKRRFTPERLQDALNWMREMALVPRGVGPHTIAESSTAAA